MEVQDLYDENRRPLGRTASRGSRRRRGEYTLVACVWVTDGQGRLLLTCRAPEKRVCPGLWENTGGAVQAGETSRQAVARELLEETGLQAAPEDFFFLESRRDAEVIYDFYLLRKSAPLSSLRMQPGETSRAAWVTLRELDRMSAAALVAPPIARRYFSQRPLLERAVFAEDYSCLSPLLSADCIDVEE